jgi:hypothetical protein
MRQLFEQIGDEVSNVDFKLLTLVDDNLNTFDRLTDNFKRDKLQHTDKQTASTMSITLAFNVIATQP